jgi:hypothetical protein
MIFPIAGAASDAREREAAKSAHRTPRVIGRCNRGQEDRLGAYDIRRTGVVIVSTEMSGIGVRRAKAALSSGCKSHPAKRSSRKQSEQSWR